MLKPPDCQNVMSRIQIDKANRHVQTWAICSWKIIEALRRLGGPRKVLPAPPKDKRKTAEHEEDLSSTQDISDTLFSGVFMWNTKKRDAIFQNGMPSHYKAMPPYLMGSKVEQVTVIH